jgi:hypothetical protein
VNPVRALVILAGFLFKNVVGQIFVFYCKQRTCDSFVADGTVFVLEKNDG